MLSVLFFSALLHAFMKLFIPCWETFILLLQNPWFRKSRFKGGKGKKLNIGGGGLGYRERPGLGSENTVSRDAEEVVHRFLELFHLVIKDYSLILKILVLDYSVCFKSSHSSASFRVRIRYLKWKSPVLFSSCQELLFFRASVIQKVWRFLIK